MTRLAPSLQDKAEPRVPFELRWPKATFPKQQDLHEDANKYEMTRLAPSLQDKAEPRAPFELRWPMATFSKKQDWPEDNMRPGANLITS